MANQPYIYIYWIKLLQQPKQMTVTSFDNF